MPLALPKSLRRLSTNVPLSWVLTVPFVLPTIGAVALVGYLSYQSGLATVENMGRQLVAQTNERVTQEVKTYLQTPLLINRLNVDAVNQKQLDLQNVPALESALFNRLQQFDQVSAVLFVSPQGKFRVVERLPKLYLGIADPPQPDKLLIYRLDSQSRRGQLVTTVNGLDVRRDRPWYQRATTTGKLGWNPISQYGTSKALTLDASQPVSDRTTKRLLGVFAVHVRLDYLSEFLHHLDISRFGQVIIMDQSGALVATSTQEQLYTIAAGTGSQSQLKQLNINESHDNLTRSLGKYLHDRQSTLGALEQSQDLEFRYKGEPQYLEITPYQDPYGLNWRILTVIPRSHFLEPIQHNTRRTLLLCLLTLGVAIGLGLLAANRLTATFAQLNGASRELAIGNLAQRLPTDSPISELNDLAQTFNQMAEQLQQSFDRIKTALEESKEKFTTIFRTSPDPIAIASLAEGCLLEVNDSLLEFFGYSPAEMIGCTALELNLWSNLNERDRYRALLQQQRRVRNLEVQMRTKAGEVKTILLSAEIRTLEGQDRSIVMHRDISDRKAAELALQQSEARYRAIVENQTELIARFLPDTTLVFVNDAYCRYFGINQEDIIGKSYAPIVYEADRDKVARIVQSMSIVNPTAIVENRVLLNGDIRWMQWVNRMLLDEQGNFTEFQAVGRDITKLKQTEEALRKSEANLLQAQQIAHVGSWEIELETQKITWSEELFRIFGLNPAQLKPSRVKLLKIIPAEDRGVLIAAVDRVIAEGTPYEVEHRIRRPDGTIRYLISKGQAALNDQQQVYKLYCTALDITERKQAEAALQESETRFRQLAETVREGFFVFETESSHYSYVNQAYETIIGTPSQAFHGEESFSEGMSHWLNNIHPDDRNRIEAGLQRERQGDHFHEEYRFIRQNGEIRWLLSQAFPIQDETGTIVRIVGTVEDITDRKQLEQSLRAQAEAEHLLATITQNIRQSLELEQILATTVLEIQQSLNTDRVLIFRLNPDGSGQVIQEAVVPAYPMTDHMRWEDEHFPEDCYEYYRQGNLRIVPDVATDEWAGCLTEFLQEVGVKSKVVAPIVQASGESSAEVWGLLIVHACSHYRHWQESEAVFLQRICNQLAIAIDQANLYQQLQTELAERRQTEAALRRSEARLAMAQRVAQVGHWEWHLESQTRTWSEATFHHWGLDPTQPEPTFAELLQMLHPDDRASWQQTIATAITTGLPYVLDLHVMQTDGSIHCLESRGEPLLNAQGQVVKLVGTSLDITNRKQTEETLKEREAMLRAIGDNLAKGFIYQLVHEPEKDFYFSYISAGIEPLLGIKPEDVLQNPKIMHDLIVEEDRSLHDQLTQESLKSLSIFEMQMRKRTAWGEIQWSSVRSVPRRLKDGRTVWDGVEVDITSIKRIEEALRASEEQFRRAFDDAPIGVSLISPTGQFLKANTCYCNIVGYSEAELLALTFQELTHPADLKADLEGFRQLLIGEVRSFQMEKRYITKQGTTVPVLVNVAPIRDEDGQLLYLVGHIQDIRDRLKVERMKDEFISVISHELRTPLTSIRGALGILGTGVFKDRPEKAEHMLQIAINNSDRLVRLVNDILTLERLDSGKVQLVMEHCQVEDLMQQAVDSVQAIADQNAITLCLTPLRARLWAAPDTIIQTFTNLLSNAIKFSSTGNTVWFKAEMGNEQKSSSTSHSPPVASFYAVRERKALRATATPYVLFTIKDEGRGIPQDKLEVIFEQFQQVDVSDSRQKGGTGLGLAICKKIVQQHNGQIWAESILGKGSSFYFALPLTMALQTNGGSQK